MTSDNTATSDNMDLTESVLDEGVSKVSKTPIPMELYHVSKSYRGSDQAVVQDVSFSLRQGEILSLVGESGSGKSTVAKMMCGISPATQGYVYLHGRELASFTSKQRAKHIQMVFQDPYSSLNPRRTIRGVLVELLNFHHVVPKEQIREECSLLMKRVGMDDEALDAYPSQFSGGQRQRLAIARAICVRPNILIADEAVSALDVSIQATILKLLLQLRDDLHLSIFFISHNLAVVQQISDEVMVMHTGKIVEHGSCSAVLTRPENSYTKQLIEAVPRLRLSSFSTGND